MAIVSCKECGRNISDKAEFCPSCGATSKAAVPDPAKKKDSPKKKWWEIEINRWKVATFIFAFFTVLFFIAYITHINSSPKERYPKKMKIESKKLFSHRFLARNNFTKEFEDRLEKLYRYKNEAFHNSSLRYLQIVKIAKYIEDYDKFLLSMKDKKIVLDNNKTVSDFILAQKKFQKRIFPRLRRLYAAALKIKFRGVDKSASGGYRRKYLAVSSHIFTRNKDIKKFHLIIEDDLKKLRFRKVYYISEKRKRFKVTYSLPLKKDEEF